MCGNHIVEAGEQCDDGNTTSGDGCSATCQTEAACPDGIWKLPVPLVYSCCAGFTDFQIDGFVFTTNGIALDMDAYPVDPVTLISSLATCPAGSFLGSGSVVNPGATCAANYSLTGAFTGPASWQGNLHIMFSGGGCGCFGTGTPCTEQWWYFTASR